MSAADPGRVLPDRLGKYAITGTLGRGAMGIVYDARDPVIERRVAIKTVRLAAGGDTEAEAELARFRREAQAAGRLHHPNVVGVYDYGETEQVAYIVMEFVDGTSLKALLDAGERLPPARVVEVMQGLLAGLQYSHDRGVVHRDIKPANVMLTRDGMVKIADFGIARIESSSMTQAGTIMGTPAYMSPEQFMGQTVDARTDIYSAGVLLYQLLTGERPFDGGMTAIMHKALHTTPPPPSQLSVNAPAALDGVVAKAMAKRPEDRFATAAAFASALAAGLTAAPVPAAAEPDADATMVSRPAPPPRAPAPAAARPAPPSAATPPKRGLGAGLIAGVAALVVVAAGTGAFLLLRPQPAPPATQTQTPAQTQTQTPAQTQAADQQAARQQAEPPTAKPPGPGTAGGTSPPATQTAQMQAPQGQAPQGQAPQGQAQSGPIAGLATGPATGTAAGGQPSGPTPSAATGTAPPPSPEQERAAIAAAIAPIGCKAIAGDVAEGGAVHVEGLASAAQADRLRKLVQGAAPKAAVQWDVRAVGGLYCPVLDAIAPALPAFGAAAPDLRLALKHNATRLAKNDWLVPVMVTPPFQSVLTVNYFESDQTFSPLEFQNPDQTLPPHSAVSLGDPQPDAGSRNLRPPPGCNPCWQIDTPFGTDLLVAVASEHPLFAKPPASDISRDAYLMQLRAALDAARAAGQHVSAWAVPVVTIDRPAEGKK